MEIIEKEELPVSFITSFVSESWDRVGVLQDQIKSIESAFIGTEKVISVMQELLDTYLICIGQMESFLDSTDLNTSENPVEIPQIINKVKSEEVPDKSATIAPEVEVEPVSLEAAENVPIEVVDTRINKQLPRVGDEFEFFVDFEEPDPTSMPLTDEDIYPELKN